MPRKTPKPRLEVSHLDPEDFELIAVSTLGDNIARLMSNRTSPLSMLLARASTEYAGALMALVEVPLQTAEGLAQATLLQAQALRYRDMCKWLRDSLEDAEDADARIAADGDGEDEAVEELKEQLHGKRDKPAPDA